ncbi:MAG: DUF1972 domain-containing protein [Burkholderiales bacterium]|nr:DUF1972 domain-containing protein [Burkholderiales bacterium]
MKTRLPAEPRMPESIQKNRHFAFIGSAGIPNRYGGFESFLENCAPQIAQMGHTVYVTCDKGLYESHDPLFNGVNRLFIPVRSNGASSVLHDLLAFFRVLFLADRIVVLGVSGAPWFGLWRILCDLLGKRLIVNIDGVEWRRDKFSPRRKMLLRIFDFLAQRFSHVVVYDNAALVEFVIPSARNKSVEIAYSGDHVIRNETSGMRPGRALTICRIEPENNIDLLIEGFLASDLQSYTIVGNWNNSPYGQKLRERFQSSPRLALSDPIYDAHRLAELRSECSVYLHGHAVGGTNPSLVEMLFYDCELFCFDCAFNRSTAGGTANYFKTSAELAARLNLLSKPSKDPDPLRASLREKYTSSAIARAYVDAAG